MSSSPDYYDAPGCVDAGDTGWVLLATILVLGMMPALAFFEAGLLRRKNTLSIITEVFVGLAVMQLMWYLIGFSLVFAPDTWGIIGGFDYVFLYNIGNVCLKNAKTIPGLAFASFESMFAAVTPLLMTGAVAERMKFRSFLLFIILWEVIVYYPLAHWIWGGGFLGQWGVYDFAGGIVIHTSSGASSLVLAFVLGHRQEFDKYHGEFPPHNIPLAAIGTALLWMGWYGFNAGSALTAGTVAAYAISATTIASTVGVIVWSFLSIIRHRHVHTIAVLNGAIAGMAGITPASGYIESYWAFLIAIFVVIAAYGAIVLFKDKLRIDDALDVSSVHGVTGALGSIALGIFADQTVNPNGPNGWITGNFNQVLKQLCAVLLAMVYPAIVTYCLLFLFRFSKFFKLTVEPEIEKVGLDYYYHGDVAYKNLEAAGTYILQETEVEDEAGTDYDESTPLRVRGPSIRIGEESEKGKTLSINDFNAVPADEVGHHVQQDALERQQVANTRSHQMMFVRQDTSMELSSEVRDALSAKNAGGFRW